MRLEEQLRRSIADRLDQVVASPDLPAVVARGRARRRLRWAGAAMASTLALGAGAFAVQSLAGSGSVPAGADPRPEEFAPVGQLDFTEGLRAYMSPDPDGELWLGGRSFPVGSLEHIDTDATATPYGMLYFDRDQRAHLLREDGTDTPLAAAPETPSQDFHPSSKADARLPLVAWTEHGESAVTVRLYDLRAEDAVDSIVVACTPATCADVSVDAVDQGLVFVATAKGTYVWDPGAGGETRWTLLGGPGTRVADARDKRILYTGPTPTPTPDGPIDSSWSFTKGAIDAQLSFDGSHVLYWSTRLEPTTQDGEPIQLDVRAGDLVWVTFDTDGSVLVAVPDAGSRGMTSTVSDCEMPSGLCTELGEVKTENGDPVFIGNDM